MLVNATQFPGPALWQGLMLLLMPLVFWVGGLKNGKYMTQVCIAYAVFGLLLFIIILAVDKS